MIDNDRLNHSVAVARKMVSIGKELGLQDDDLRDLFALGFNHDFAYEFGDNTNHNTIGGEILRNNGYKYWREVYYHGNPDAEYSSLFLNILNEADLQVDKYGNSVSIDERLKDIKSRYGENSSAYINACSMAQKILNNPN